MCSFIRAGKQNTAAIKSRRRGCNSKDPSAEMGANIGVKGGRLGLGSLAGKRGTAKSPKGKI